MKIKLTSTKFIKEEQNLSYKEEQRTNNELTNPQKIGTAKKQKCYKFTWNTVSFSPSHPGPKGLR